MLQRVLGKKPAVPLTRFELEAILCGEPWCWPPWWVERVSFSWYARFVNHPRDDKGRPEIAPKGPKRTAREAFFHRWRQRGMADQEITRRWRVYQAESAQRGKLLDG